MIDLQKLLELAVPGIFVGLIMLGAQQFAGIRRDRTKLIAEEGWRAKRDAFLSAIRIVDQYLSVADWSGPDVPENRSITGTRPTGLEINTVCAQLMLTAASAEVPKKFMGFFIQGGQSSPSSRAEFIILLRKELFASAAPMSPDEVPWVF